MDTLLDRVTNGLSRQTEALLVNLEVRARLSETMARSRALGRTSPRRIRGGALADPAESARDLIRAALATGTLWRLNHTTRVFAGFGTDRPCCVCGKAITQAQVEYELASPHGAIVRTHLPCYDAWNSESRIDASASGDRSEPLG